MTNVIHTRMIKNLPNYERNNELLNEIIRSIAIKMQNLEVDTEQTHGEMFIDTAIETIKLHERDLNISFNSGLSLQQKRELIMANYRATLDQTTDESIKSIASAFSNGEVEILPTDVEGVSEIRFVGSIGIPDNVPGLAATIYNILPAHLDVIFTYTFNVWDDIANLTWNQVSNYTWDEILNEELV